MNVLNYFGSVPTGSTIGVVLCVVLYAISIATYNIGFYVKLKTFKIGDKKR
jgi:hypothetical protein